MNLPRPKTVRSLAWLRRRLALRPFWRETNGATAVEFALIAVPFLGLLCAIFETGLVFLESAQLQEVTQAAARSVLVNSATNGITYQTFLNTYVCPRLLSTMNCSNVVMDISNPANWSAESALDNASFYSSSANAPTATISMPSAGNIAIVRILYPLNQIAAIVTGGTGAPIGQIHAGETTLSGNYVHMLMGIYAFKVE